MSVNETNRYDVGIVGFWYGKNYGSVLTYYALYKVIEGLGYKPILINKHLKLWEDSFYHKSTLANRFFQANDCKRSRIRNGNLDWLDLNNFCDMFLVGSDVVWKCTLPQRIGYHFFLDFVSDYKRKIAYASSFGGEWLAKESITQTVMYYLSKFDSISCRENEGVALCRDVFGIDAIQVLDPVFLLSNEQYGKMADRSKRKVPEHYICAYVLGPGKTKRDLLLSLQGMMGKGGHMGLINLVNAGNEEKGGSLLGLEAETGIDIEDWLRYIRDCDLYIGDSFHGICFSIIFRKNFILIRNRISPSRCRFDTLLSLLELENRSIYADEDITLREDLLIDIDYDKVYEKLAPLAEDSKTWLAAALCSPKQSRTSEYDILNEKILKLENENIELRRQVSEIRDILSKEDKCE